MAFLRCISFEDAPAPEPTEFAYTGAIQEYSVPKTGTYILEVWGAQGGTASGQYGSVGGGNGGYAYGKVRLTKGQTIYVVVGGQGTGGRGASGSDRRYAGGYNGGGSGHENYGNPNWGVAGGGGATHIGKSNALLKDTPVADLLIAAGGGGGGIIDSWVPTRYYPGSGGGTEGTGGGGSQSAAGQGGGYGYGGNAGWSWQDGWQGGGGGGGYYGGGWHSVNEGKGGGGGSGYIGGVTDGTMSVGTANFGNGKATITFDS